MLGRSFVDRFRSAQRSGGPLALFAEDEAGFLAAVTEEPDALEQALDEAIAAPAAPIAELLPGSFASAACTRDGGVVVCDERFASWLAAWSIEDGGVVPPDETAPRLALLVKDDTGRPVAVASGCAAACRGWPLSPDVRRAIDNGTAYYALLAFRPVEDGIQRAASALRFTGAETRLVAALAETGNLKDAAMRVGIAYESARKLVAGAMAKAGAPRQTELVRAVLHVAAGELLPPSGIDRLFADLFALTLRQARIARGIAHGLTRADVAVTLGVSEHAVKTDLKLVYLACAIEHAVDLARVVAEVEALAGLATACDVMISTGAAEAEPLRLIPRRWADGRIAFADHGPADGVPLVIVHASATGRSISPRLIAALQAEGLRPIAFDRAGFGLTDWVEVCPYKALTHDLDDLLEAIGAGPAVLLVRGVPGAAVTAASVLPDRIAGAVVLNPDPPVEFDRRRRGMMGAGRALFFDRPWLGEKMATLLSQRTSAVAIERLLRQSVAGSAIDLAVLDDPAELGAMIRSLRQCALGMRGFLGDMRTQSSRMRATPIADGSHWTLVVGERDPLYYFPLSEDYWRSTLPGVRIDRIPDGGRWLHATHSAVVARACRAVAERSCLLS